MTSANAKHQRDHRKRRSEQFARRGNALTTIIDKLDGNEKPMAVEIREIAQEGLK